MEVKVRVREREGIEGREIGRRVGVGMRGDEVRE